MFSLQTSSLFLEQQIPFTNITKVEVSGTRHQEGGTEYMYVWERERERERKGEKGKESWGLHLITIIKVAASVTSWSKFRSSKNCVTWQSKEKHFSFLVQTGQQAKCVRLSLRLFWLVCLCTSSLHTFGVPSHLRNACYVGANRVQHRHMQSSVYRHHEHKDSTDSIDTTPGAATTICNQGPRSIIRWLIRVREKTEQCCSVRVYLWCASGGNCVRTSMLWGSIALPRLHTFVSSWDVGTKWSTVPSAYESV